LLELLAVAGRIDELSVVGAQALDDLAHDPDLTAAVHLLMARAAVGAGVPCRACAQRRREDRSIICGSQRSGIGSTSSTDRPVLAPPSASATRPVRQRT
jgi:hypothetical protein